MTHKTYLRVWSVSLSRSLPLPLSLPVPTPTESVSVEADMEKLEVLRTRSANTNLDAESKRSAASSSTATSAHFRSPWQQSVNVFGSWSRPDCVQELHQEAQLNLQSLLQDFEEQLYDTKLTGQTFRHPTASSQSSDDTSTTLSRSPVSLNNKRPEFIFLPASKGQVCEEDETSSVSISRGTDPSPSPSPSPCGSDRPLVGWSSTSLGPPVAEKPRWHLGRRTPTHLLSLDVTGEGKLLGVDLLQGSCYPSPSLGCGGGGQPRSLEPVTDTPVQHIPLRKTHSDLDPSLSLPQSPRNPPPTLGTMDHSAALLCSNSPSQSWNGPKGSTFSPGAWNEPYSYSLAASPLGKGPATMPKGARMVGMVGGQGGELMCPSQTSLGLSVSSGSQSHSSSFTSISEPSGHRHPGTIGMMMGRRSETEGAAASPTEERSGSERGMGGGERRERSARSVAAANAFKFRERSLSTPTDSGSFCSTDNICGGMYGVGGLSGAGNGTNGNGGSGLTEMQHPHHHYPRGEGGERGESYALFYPSGSSEDGSNSIDNVSVTDGNFPPDGRLRLRSRSISLKKSKRKPPPPVRSVSLMKNLGDAEGRVHGHNGGHYRDGRPKSLHIPRDHLQDFQPDFLLPSSSSLSKPDLEEPELGHGGMDGPPSLEVQGPDPTELSFPAHWQLEEWKASDPYRSLSGSSTATGTTVIECMKVRGSSESLLDSPSTSRATSPSLLSVEAESTKASSPFKPPGLMSPSSGYSSQSETPTPITPSNQVAGTPTGPASTLGCKMRPKIPERKSSLPATSPRDPAARSRLSFEMPVNAHLDLSSIKPKQKASRRHSDTSTAAKPGKLSAGSQSTLPVVTTNELRNIRLRSVSRTDLEDCLDGASNDIIEEERGRDLSPPPVIPGCTPGPLVAPKPKPPVAFKPPLPKRPLNILLKSPSSSPVASDSPPASPVDPPRPMPNPSIYMVVGRKPKLKKTFPHNPTSPFRPQEHPQTFPLHYPQSLYDAPSFPHTQSLYDLPPLPLPQPLLEDPTMEPEFNSDLELRLGPEDGGSLPSPCSNQEVLETQDKSKSLPSRMTISCLAELDKKKPKVPPPVPKKPNVLLLPSNGTTDRQGIQTDSPAALRSPVGAFPPEEIPGKEENQENYLGMGTDEESSMESSLQDSSLTDVEGTLNITETGRGDDAESVEESSLVVSDKTELHITEEMDDDVRGHTPTTHTTEDLFTKIHRSKRKVLGRKEPGDSFGSRQSLVSPVKHSTSGGDIRTLTLGSTPRSTSRNDNFMALLQKKGSKSSTGGARVSAMELLKSTNPLARRVTEFSTSADGGGDMTTGNNGTRLPQDQ
ncbi:NHS-like protein 2 isoform X2 [Salmo salar]|uniref:NHS-like protein 2 isoform X2 n=1 Tax=Salmo salar TaxID=8030 RepID=A0A1S3SEY1_SALSA|nr:NHS-like protein 2 isoform X2 [Salmo salar]|eukprot:XP_014062905.1 PREDICTED: NHS-like protein 2 isoform X2 [Salmo salar]